MEKVETGGTRGWFLENPRDLPMDPRRSRGKGVRLLAGAARRSGVRGQLGQCDV